tara:strand:+ start:103 stop:942 length:840 start_codon:yes stop_codon:yes gene_type:complete
MNNCIGVMQGRLLPKYKGRYQAHPLGYWQNEFPTARSFGLDCIEFILDFNDYKKNPLLSTSGILEIKKIALETNVDVKTVCADYFMDLPFHSDNDEVAEESINIFKKLIKNAGLLKVSDIVIPCVDQSSIKHTRQYNLFIKRLLSLIPFAEEFEVNLSIESDLSPKEFSKLLDCFDSKRITVNYDTGNSASLGFDVEEELEEYGNKISDIHIKDRLLGGGPVELGMGYTNFEKFFKKLEEFNYSGPFILQAYRDEGGEKIFKKQYDWIKPYLESFKCAS